MQTIDGDGLDGACIAVYVLDMTRFTANVRNTIPAERRVRTMSKARAEQLFPGYALEERLAVTDRLATMASEARQRGAHRRFDDLCRVIREREDAGFGRDAKHPRKA